MLGAHNGIAWLTKRGELFVRWGDPLLDTVRASLAGQHSRTVRRARVAQR